MQHETMEVYNPAPGGAAGKSPDGGGGDELWTHTEIRH